MLGLDGVPDAGEIFNVVTDEKAAKSLVEHRHEPRRKKELAGSGRVSLENILDKIKSGDVKEVKVVLKADVQGSIEAIANALTKLSTDNGRRQRHLDRRRRHHRVRRQPRQGVVGHRRRLQRPPGRQGRSSWPSRKASTSSSTRSSTTRIDDVKKAMVGMLAPIKREKVMGKAEVRQVFTIPKAGTIAGCFVTEGKIKRKAQLRLVRDSVVIYTGKVGSLRRFKDDVSEVAQGYECGLVDRGLRRPQGGRRHRGLRDRDDGADAREPDRRRASAN